MHSRTVLGVAACTGAIIVLGQIDVSAFLGGLGQGSESPPLASESSFQPVGLHGPDVIVGDLPATHRWATDSTETAYSIATTSCNVGDVNLQWMQSPDNRHPVIGQNLFRRSADGRRFEQIGQSWLKHAFCALQQDLTGCGNCANTPGCLQHLEPGCSDPYTAMRNGSQTGLGPKWQVNASTGVFPVPWAQGEGTSGSFNRRLRVKNVDIDPALNPGARYFMEGQYVTQDDAAWGNLHNNATYREVTVDPVDFDLSLGGIINRQKAAIQAWRSVPGVNVVFTEVPEEGAFYVGYGAFDNGDGTWDYEYAVQNLNSDRSAKAFSVPVGDGLDITNVGFHDVDYHSGDGMGGVNFDGNDWTWEIAGGYITWRTDEYDANEAANALRWGTLYNFRFTSMQAPVVTEGRLDLFKPGTPTFVTSALKAPQAAPAPCDGDVSGDGEVGFDDLTSVLSAWGACGVCPEDVDQDGNVGFPDLLAVLSGWGDCP
jgi:hypothetical protein